MVLSEGLSSRVTSSSVTSSRGSTSRELEQLIIESGSLAIQRVLHVSVHGVSWWLVSVPRPSQGRLLRRDTFIESTFIPWVKPAARGFGGPDGVHSSRLHEAFMQRTLPDLWAHPSPCNLAAPNDSCHVSHAETALDLSPETRERKIGQSDMVAGKFPQPHRVNRPSDHELFTEEFATEVTDDDQTSPRNRPSSTAGQTERESSQPCCPTVGKIAEFYAPCLPSTRSIHVKT
jgi:hypothetical protein